MRLIIGVLAAIAFLVPSVAAGEKERVVHVYTWKDYFSPRAVRLFEERHNCRVEFDFYDSNETMFASLMQGGGYEIVTPVSYIATQLARQGVIRPLNRSLLPNLRHIVDPRAAGSAEHGDARFTIPYTVTVSGVGYNRSMVPPEALGSWGIFGDSRFAGRMTMMTDIRDTVGAALKYLGHSVNASDQPTLDAAAEVLADWKQNLALFDTEGAKEGLDTGRYAVIHAYNGDIAKLMQTNPDLDFFIPREGSAITSDDFAICSDAEEPDLAHAFINHFLDPEIAALNMEDVLYPMPNPEALERAQPVLSQHPALAMPDELVEKCEAVRYLGGSRRERFDLVWEKVLLDD